jgi:CHAT domain-containing protein
VTTDKRDVVGPTYTTYGVIHGDRLHVSPEKLSDDHPFICDHLALSFEGCRYRLLTGTAVAQNLPGSTHLHLACHGGFDAGEPLNSALYLSRGDRLTLRDLLDGNLELSSQRLAVLSACQSGITEFTQVPDEMIGLPAGSLQAGVPGVVATLWPVNDRSTAVLVTEFYRLLLDEGQDPAAALRGACGYLHDATGRDLAAWFQRCYDDSGGTDLAAYEAAADLRSCPNPEDQPYANPVYWAGFVYSGA